ncbi:E3 ubiquitin-protein ligase RFWD2, partial [Sigmodon hispidus]
CPCAILADRSALCQIFRKCPLTVVALSSVCSWVSIIELEVRDEKLASGQSNLHPRQLRNLHRIGTRTYLDLDKLRNEMKFTRTPKYTLHTIQFDFHIRGDLVVTDHIEFDRDCDYFAIAGVTKKIKVYEYGTVIQDAVDIHYPENEMTCNSKISCISWSSYHKNLLASSDYEGTVILWDGFTGQRSKVYQEHEKRCWSVDFNLMDPKLLASGSDDAKVKLWSTNLDNSVASIEAKANVCCVKFSPSSRYHLAFGCADHCVHYYDLRNTKQPIMVFKGHRKAVSYAKFVSGEEIVSASTDSQLKLWNVGKPYCLRSFKGHINEKNFVGLASNGDYIACGSENNSLYLYYKGLSKTLLTFKFDTVKSVLDKDRKEDDTNEFVSAVCWRALSDGILSVLIYKVLFRERQNSERNTEILGQ